MDFATKYRIKELKDIIGNENTKEILSSFINKENHPHSYLFYGERGCGKTTIARILSEKFNCEIIELNNSNNRGISTVRETIYEGSMYTTFSGLYKGFLLDEVHKLTNDAQNALLKILEEPPESAYFFLCTTEPNKLLKTIRSRCQQFEMEIISNRLLYPYLIDISIREGKEIPKDLARKIAETSDGHVRDALKILESVLQLDDEKKQNKIAEQRIDDQKQVIDLCRHLLNGSWNDCREILKDLQRENPESIRKIILSYMQKVLLDSSSTRAAIVIDGLREVIYDYAILCVNIFEIFS